MIETIKKIARRVALLRLASLTAFAPLAVSSVRAAAVNYPEKMIRWIVAFAPGGSADVLSRMLSPVISVAMGQSIVVDNRTGAAGNIGASIVAHAPPDGYTIGFAYSGTHSINPSIYPDMPFKQSDFAPIIWLSSVPLVIVVRSDLPVDNVKELITLAKSKPGKLNFGSAGIGSINHLAGELFDMMAGTRLTHVPYRGGAPATVALLGGEIALIFSEPASIVEYIKAGKLRAIAVTSTKRSLLLPELSTVAEAGVPGFDVTSWNGMLAPAATPAAVIKRLNTEFTKALAAPDMRKRMLASGFEPVGGPPERFGKLIQNETEKWAKVVKATGMKVV